MTVNRRDFVATVGLSLLGGATAQSAAPQAAEPAAESYSDWSQVRAQFDLAPDLLHFSQFYLVSHPRPVRQSIERYRRMLDANPFITVEHGMGFEAFLGGPSLEESRPSRVQRAAAEYLGGHADEVALTDSTTQGLALIYNGLTLKPGDEILTTTHDHYVHHESIRLAAERNGASARRISLYDEPAAASAQQMEERLRRAIGPRTRVVGLTWVHSSTGVKLPIRMLAEVVAAANRNRSEQDEDPDARILDLPERLQGLRTSVGHGGRVRLSSAYRTQAHRRPHRSPQLAVQGRTRTNSEAETVDTARSRALGWNHLFRRRGADPG